MDSRREFQGTSFVWDASKASANLHKHGVSFEQAMEVFFDPFVRVVDASRNDEARDAAVGFDAAGRVLFVVHLLVDQESIRIVSARRATLQERRHHEHS